MIPRTGDAAPAPLGYAEPVQLAASPPAIRRAIIVEDIAATSAWLTGVLRTAFGDILVETVADLRAARRWLQGQRGPAGGLLALVDLGLPDGSGNELIGELRDRLPDAWVVVTTVFDDDAHLMHAMASGAHGYLLKDRDAGELVTQLCGLDRGDAPISPAIARRILDQFRVHATFMSAAADEGAVLTPRETDVLRLIGRGLTLIEAARVLTLSSQTVATHVKKIYRKLGIATRAEAALEAARRSLT